jgi:hypothetical protein
MLRFPLQKADCFCLERFLIGNRFKSKLSFDIDYFKPNVRMNLSCVKTILRWTDSQLIDCAAQSLWTSPLMYPNKTSRSDSESIGAMRNILFAVITALIGFIATSIACFRTRMIGSSWLRN